MKKLNLVLILSFLTFGIIFSSCNTKTDENNNEEADTTILSEGMLPLEDFFKNPEKTAYKISPNGEYYSYLAPYEDRLNVFIQKIGEDDATRITNSVKRDIAGYFWANNDKILYLKDSGGDENYQLFGVNIDGTDSICYTDFKKVRTQIIDDLENIPNEILIGLNKRNKQIFDVYRLYLDSGEMEMIAENPGNIQGWITDHDGKLRAAIGIIGGTNTNLLYRETEWLGAMAALNDKFKSILLTDFKQSFSPQFFTFDNKNLIGVSNIGRDKSAVVEFNIETKKETILYQNDNYDVSGASYSRKRMVLTSASYTSWKREKHFFDEESKKYYEIIQNQLEGYEFALTGTTKEEDKYIVRSYSDRSMGAYFIFDIATEKLEKIAEVTPWIDENVMASQYPIEYKSRDGLTIHGYLTLPKGETIDSAKNLPVVVNPHGGPWARDSWGYNPQIQFLANRGYAVFQMNFRGSTGYGTEFMQCSFKEWGKKMQDDVTDGTQWLIDKGIADSERIAIYGGSYGGYATLMGLIREPDLYAAGIDYVGVSNLFTFMETIPPYWKPMLKIMYEMVGDPVADSLLFVENSPVFHADEIKAPLFIAQGKNDPRVNIDEADQMVAAMKERGIEVEYMVKNNEGHGFRNEENRFDFYRAMEKFLNKHLN